MIYLLGKDYHYDGFINPLLPGRAKSNPKVILLIFTCSHYNDRKNSIKMFFVLVERIINYIICVVTILYKLDLDLITFI